MTAPAGAAHWAGIGAAVLLVASAAAALVVGDDGGQQVATDATTSSTAEPATTTTTVAPSTTTSSMEISILRRVTSTTATTAKPPTRTWSVSPASGPSGTHVTARGVGCTGTETSVTLRFYDPSGREYNGDGGAAQPDGTWSIPFGMTGAPGRYKVTASCTQGAKALFAYAPQYFTITG